MLGKIYRWVQTALSQRRGDVEMRRSIQHQMKMARDAAIRTDAERTEKMNAQLEEAKAVSIFD